MDKSRTEYAETIQCAESIHAYNDTDRSHFRRIVASQSPFAMSFETSRSHASIEISESQSLALSLALAMLPSDFEMQSC